MKNTNQTRDDVITSQLMMIHLTFNPMNNTNPIPDDVDMTSTMMSLI